MKETKYDRCKYSVRRGKKKKYRHTWELKEERIRRNTKGKKVKIKGSEYLSVSCKRSSVSVQQSM